MRPTRELVERLGPGNAAVAIDELYLLSVVTGQASLTGADFALFA